MSRRIVDAASFVGSVFGRLTVVGVAEKLPGSGNARVMCQCACGSEPKPISLSVLKRGTTVSCGCYGKERRRAVGQAKASAHRYAGFLKTPEHRCWKQMRDRCEVPHHPAHVNYGALGIAVCERWSDFFSFLDDMGPRPSPSHSLDRIDNSKGYSPENCRWATRAEQNRNTRRSRMITANGETLCALDWSIRLGGSKKVVIKRLRAGWSEQDAVLTPIGGRP